MSKICVLAFMIKIMKDTFVKLVLTTNLKIILYDGSSIDALIVGSFMKLNISMVSESFLKSLDPLSMDSPYL